MSNTPEVRRTEPATVHGAELFRKALERRQDTMKDAIKRALVKAAEKLMSGEPLTKTTLMTMTIEQSPELHIIVEYIKSSGYLKLYFGVLVSVEQANLLKRLINTQIDVIITNSAGGRSSTQGVLTSYELKSTRKAVGEELIHLAPRTVAFEFEIGIDVREGFQQAESDPPLGVPRLAFVIEALRDLHLQLGKGIPEQKDWPIEEDETDQPIVVDKAEDHLPKELR